MAAACSRTAKNTPKGMPEVTSAPLPHPAARTCDGAELVEWDFSGVTTRVAILKPDCCTLRATATNALVAAGPANGAAPPSVSSDRRSATCSRSPLASSTWR